MTTTDNATLRDLIVGELTDGPASLAGLARMLHVDIPAVAAELQRMCDARLVRSTNRGWQLRTIAGHRRTFVGHRPTERSRPWR